MANPGPGAAQSQKHRDSVQRKTAPRDGKCSGIRGALARVGLGGGRVARNNRNDVFRGELAGDVGVIIDEMAVAIVNWPLLNGFLGSSPSWYSSQSFTPSPSVSTSEMENLKNLITGDMAAERVTIAPVRRIVLASVTQLVPSGVRELCN